MVIGSIISGFAVWAMVESLIHYDWQLPDGSRCEGIRITVDSVLQEDSLDDHVVRLSYEASDFNDKVASWIGEQIERTPHVRVEHSRLRNQPLFWVPEDES